MVSETLGNVIVGLLREILAELRNKRDPKSIPMAAQIPLTDLIDSVDVKSILKISDRTLYRIKKTQLIHTVRIGKRDYYSATEINGLINYFMK